MENQANPLPEESCAGLLPGLECVTGPYNLARLEFSRRRLLEQTNLGAAVPTDLFVFHRGEAPRREVTKIGGLPYWSRRRPWPLAGPGWPMTFIGQLCFADSRDLFESLPGDVLLIFAEGRYILDWLEEDKSALAFQWVNLGETDWVRPEDIPPVRWPIVPCWGDLYRTVDYPESARKFQPGSGLSRLAVVEGTKIGGSPRWIRWEEDLPGRFLGAIGSICPCLHQPYPFLDCPTLSDADPDWFQWGKGGSLYLFLDDKGYIYWTVQSY